MANDLCKFVCIQIIATLRWWYGLFHCQHCQNSSLIMRKPALCEKKGTDQLHCNLAADQCLCLRYIDRTIPLLSKSDVSSLQPSSVAAQLGLCQTWLETQKTGFLMTRLIQTFDLFLVGLEETKKESKKLKYSVEVQHVVSYWFLRTFSYMSLVVRKPVFGVSDQVRHKPVCAAI